MSDFVPAITCAHCGEPIEDGQSFQPCEICDSLFHAGCYSLPSYHQPRPRGRRRNSAEVN